MRFSDRLQLLFMSYMPIVIIRFMQFLLSVSMETPLQPTMVITECFSLVRDDVGRRKGRSEVFQLIFQSYFLL